MSAVAGFTLIEMLVVLAIVGLMAAVVTGALPKSGGRVQRQKLAAKLSRIIVDARTQAALSGRPVSVDLDRMGLAEKGMAVSALPDGKARFLFYPDGSTSGGEIAVRGEPSWQLDWLSGALHDVR